MEKIRLQKFIAESGICSRRKAEEYIAAGKVKVNGEVAAIGDKVNPENDKVVFDGRAVKQISEEKVYIMLNKPRGFITTMEDERSRRCIKDLVADIPSRILPVGRLDKDSEGLLLMTNDGEMIYKLTHPKHSISKFYLVTVAGKLSDQAVETLNLPFEIDGYTTVPAKVEALKRMPDRAVLRIELFEGRNRQIRKMCEDVGLKILRLKRYAVGKIKLSEVKPGKWRELTPQEINYLKKV